MLTFSDSTTPDLTAEPHLKALFFGPLKKIFPNLKALLQDLNKFTVIRKKVEVCLRLFDIFERNRVFIFLWESWGTHPADWGLR